MLNVVKVEGNSQMVKSTVEWLTLSDEGKEWNPVSPERSAAPQQMVAAPVFTKPYAVHSEKSTTRPPRLGHYKMAIGSRQGSHLLEITFPIFYYWRDWDCSRSQEIACFFCAFFSRLTCSSWSWNIPEAITVLSRVVSITFVRASANCNDVGIHSKDTVF